MTEIFSPFIESASPEVIAPAELEEILRRARAPIVKEGFVEPWTGDQSGLDPAQAGWEQAAENMLAKIQEMQSSGLVQLTTEGLTPKQAAEKADESAKLAEANKRAAELAKQLLLEAERKKTPLPEEMPEPLMRDQWNLLSDDQRNANLGEWYRKLRAGEPIEDWQKQALRDYNLWGGGSFLQAGVEEPVLGGPTAEEAAAGLAAAVAAGPGTQVIDGGNVVIPPAGDKRREKPSISVEGMKQALKNYLSTWLNRKKLSLVGEFTGGTAAGFLANLCFTELIAKNPQMATLIPSVLTNMQIWGGGLLTNTLEAGALDVLLIRKKFELAKNYTRTAKLAERISVARSADNLVDWASLLTATTARLARDALIRPAATGFIAGAWLYAGLAGAGAFGQDHMLFNGAEAVAPIVSDGGAIGGLPPDERGGVGIVLPGNVDHQSQWPTAGVGPGAAGGGLPQPPAGGGEYNPPFTGPNVPVAPEPLPPFTAGPGAELTSRAVEVMPGDTLTKLVSEAGGNAYGYDLTQTILKSADVLTGPQNPNSELAKNLIDYLNSHPDVTWQDVINGKYDSVMINGFPIKEVFSNAIHWIFPGQKFNVVVGAGVP